MKKYWMRRVAIILVLCLVVNEHTGIFTVSSRTQNQVSAEEGKITVDASDIFNVENEEKSTEDMSVSRVDESDNNPETQQVSEGGSLETPTESNSDDSTENKSTEVVETQKTEVPETKESETEASEIITSEVETESESDTAKTQESEENITETVTDESSVEETTTEMTQTQESETITETVTKVETEEITETELTTETATEMETEFEIEIETVDADLVELANADEYNVPGTVEEYINAKNSGITNFYIANAQDFKDAQELCEDSDVDGFSGVTLIITSSGEAGGVWNINSKTSGSAFYGFTGIGTESNPFKGTLKCGFENGNGVSFKIDTPIIAYLGDGATVTQMEIEGNGSCSAIAKNISGTVIISDIWVKGTFSDDDTVGLIAATIEDGSTVNVSDFTNNIAGTNQSISLTGDTAGGIAGVLNGKVTVNLADSVRLQSVTVTGNEFAGGYYGVINGDHTIDLKHERLEWIRTKTKGNGEESSAGEIAGKINNSKLTLSGEYILAEVSGDGNGGGIVGIIDTKSKIINNNSNGTTIRIVGNITTSENSGGIVGRIKGAELTIQNFKIEANLKGSKVGGVAGYSGYTGDPGDLGVFVISNTKVSSQIKDAYDAGGIFGRIEGGKATISNIEVTSTITSYTQYAGGCVGTADDTKFIIRNSDFSVTFSDVKNDESPPSLGNVIGRAKSEVAMEIQGTLKVPNMPTEGGKNGLIVGEQDRALIYLQGVGLEGHNQIVTSAEAIEKEVGTYGGVYRNQTVSSGVLIGDGTIEQVGVINNTVAKDGNDWYQLTSEADFVTLSIMLGTEAKFGSNAFGGRSTETLLSSNYRVTKSVDISYEKTGIVTLNRSDKLENETKDGNTTYYVFTGKLCGPEVSQVTITQNISKKMSNAGLFTTISGNVEFSNLILDGTVSHFTGAGGIAFQYSGTGVNSGLTLNNFTIKKKYINNIGVIGAVIARKTDNNTFALSGNNVVLASVIEAGEYGYNCSGFITQLDKAAIDMKNVTIGGSITINSTNSGGGFFGNNWNNISGVIKNINVQDSTVYTTQAVMGGFWNTLTTDPYSGYITLDTVNLKGLTVNANQTQKNCGLLVRNAQKLVINIVDYDTTGCVVNNPGQYFDEIAGITEKWYKATTQIESGIISLHSRKANFPQYYYQNKVKSLQDRTNIWTIYYYDVFQHLENTDGTVKTQISNNVLDNPSKVLLWNVVQMCSSEIRNTFNKYYSSGSVTDVYNHSYTFKGELDLSEISYYPTPQVQKGTYTGSESAEIIFGAKTNAIDMGAWKLSNEDYESQHYSLQAGLFANHGYNTTINLNDITLSGTIANLNAKSGAIMTGDIGLNSGGIFKNIILDDLWIADYSSYKIHNTGLMISRIASGTVTFDGIKMTGYEMENSTKAAAALIGYAGGEKEEQLVLKFEHMKVADDADGDSGRHHNGDVLAYASFICNYDYTDDAEKNEGSGIYLFSKTDDNVTYGKELDLSTEFSDTSDIVLTELGLSDSSPYKPYVCKVKKIEINPKTGDILKGCGTYEDPYIIENTKQFLTLYRYMNEKPENVANGEYQYETFYKLGDKWKIIKTGTDAENDFCAEKHNVTWTPGSGGEHDPFSGTGAEDAVVFGDDDFPTPDELSRAYYRLGADIDLSAITNETYKIIAADFTGFGIAERPFVGVWYGKDSTGTIHTITLPDKTNAYTNYGFIQYAQGAVVKDLIIETTGNDDEAINLTKTAGVAEAGAGVIAIILGGDNIIDNVTVNVDLRLAYQYAAIGGYVGNVKKGGLILRNVGSNSLKTFRTDQIRSDTYPFLGAVAGKVEDGYVLYEGAGTSGSYIWSGKGGNEKYPAISNYDILNGDKLRADCSGLTLTRTIYAENIVAEGKTLPATCGEVKINIPNAAALQVISMALNADAFNVRPYGYWGLYKWGYTDKARCRKAKYLGIGFDSGKTEEEITNDYQSAVKYDNVMGYDALHDAAFAYPYLYDYMGITGDKFMQFSILHYEEGLPQIHTYVNPSTVFAYDFFLDKYNEEAKIIFGRTKWELASNSYYDMSQFGKSFRGIGGLYDPTYGIGSSFHGSFDGKESTIKLNIIREIYGNENSDIIGTAGLFNSIFGSYDYFYDVEKDFSVPDAEQRDIKKSFEIKNFKLAGEIKALSPEADTIAGGVVGYMEGGNYAFSNISINSANPLSIGLKNSVGKERIKYLGGLIGRINHSGIWPANILIENCNLLGSEDNEIEFKARNRIGGLIGYVDLYEGEIIKILDSKVLYSKINTTDNHAGGFIGEAKKATIIFEGSEENKLCISDSDVDSAKATTYEQLYVGGFIGKLDAKLYIKNGSVVDSEIGDSSAINSTGGFVGYANGDFLISNVTCDDIELRSYSCIGGIIGKTSGTSTGEVKNATVTDLDIKERASFDGSAEGIGGIIGKTENEVTISDAKVKGTIENGDYKFTVVSESQPRSDTQGIGGLVGINKAKLTLSNCEADSISISTNVLNNEVSSDIVVAAGGLVGYVNGDILLKKGTVIKASNMVIEVPQAKIQAASSKGAVLPIAGACFGDVKSITISNGESSLYYNGLSSEKNTVTGFVSGGLIGRVDKSVLRLSGITVNNCTVDGTGQAGGMIGQFLPSLSGSAINPYQNVDDTPKNIVSDTSITARLAGGFCGYYSSQGFLFRMENLIIRNCTIVSRQHAQDAGDTFGAGGVIGGSYAGSKDTANNTAFNLYDITVDNNVIVNQVASDTLSATETDKLASGGLIGRITNASQNKMKFNFEYVAINGNNKIGVYSGDDISNVRLVTKNSQGAMVLTDISLPNLTGEDAYDYNAIEKLENDYGYYVGNYIGVYDETDVYVYILDTDESEGRFTTPVMSSNPPVVDVGRTTAQNIDAYRKYVHIVYGANVDDAKIASENIKDMKAEAEKALSAYDTSSDTLQTLLKESRVPKDSLERFLASYEDSYHYPGTDLTIDAPMLVYRVQNGTLQEVMESIADVMTNRAGLSSNDIGNLTITAEPKLYDGTTVTAGTISCISISGTGENKRVFTANSFDGVKDGKLSYTELVYTYSLPEAGIARKKMFRIPIFVEEPILYSVHSKIMAGKVTDVDSIKQNGVGETDKQLVIASDSDYTMLLEYTYGQSRKQMADTLNVDKVFYLQDNNGLKSLSKGTQLLLIDVTDGNKAYYYTVNDPNVTEIKFSDFKNSKGAPYVNRPIKDIADVTDSDSTDYYTDLGGHQLTGVGVEQYILTVINKDVTPVTQVYSIHSGINIEDESFESRFTLEEGHQKETVWNVVAVPGLTVNLVRKEQDANSYTDIEGAVSKAGGITVDVVFEIKASDDMYWSEKANGKLMDSSNDGKFIDIAFYLRDKSGNRVNLPTGTNISYKLDADNYSTNKALSDAALFYYYKDIRNIFDLPEFEYLINDITGNTRASVEFKFDFGGADLSGILDERYDAWIELLRTANREYPMGNGNLVDSYTEELAASGTQDLGFAIKTIDLNKLAINTYPKAKETDIINANVMFDFSEILNSAKLGAGEEIVAEKWAGYDYEVNYKLYKKTTDGTNIVYEEYTGDDIIISATEGVVSSNAGSGTLTAVYNFTVEQIKDTKVISFPCKITQKTKNLVTGKNDNHTNYKLEATLTIKDRGSQSSGNSSISKQTIDFFIYTVAKLKLDI